jgi:hypothetical protein
MLLAAEAAGKSVPLHAQARVHGTIRDSTQGTPLPLVEVLVEGMNISTLTDAEGRYSLLIPLGFHTLHFRRVGYHPLTRQLRLNSPDPLQYDLTMLSQAQRLDSIQVRAAAPPRTWPPGLDDRMKEGFGQFVTDSMLRRFEHSTLSNLLQSRVRTVRFKRMLGRNVAFSSRGGRASAGPRGVPDDCYYSIWLDGMQIWQPSDYYYDPSNPEAGMQGPPPPDLDQFRLAGVEAVEVYTAANVPAQYRSGTVCGVILLWSRTQRR